MNNKEYFEIHGLDEKFALDDFGVTSDTNTIYIPIKDVEGKVVFTKKRYLNREPKFYIPPEIKAGDYLFNIDRVKDEEWVIYVEGEMDNIRLAQDGIPAITAVTGGGNIPKDLNALKGKEIYVCLDSDNAGKSFTKNVVDALKETTSSIRVIELPEETKDICEYFHSGKTVDDFDALRKASLTADEWEIKQAPKEFEVEKLTDLINKKLPEQAWLIDNIVPAEGFCMFAGAEATGKSFLTLSIAKSVTTGEKWLGEFTVSKQVPVLLIDKENGKRRLQDRMRGLQMSGEDIFRIKFPEQFTLSDAKGQNGLTDFAHHVSKVVKTKNIGLIIVDSFVDIMEGNENISADVQTTLNQFRYLFPDIVISIIHHEGKQGGGYTKSNSDLVRGSTNIMAQVSTAFRTSRIPETKNEYKIEQTKARDSEMINPFKIRMDTQPDPLHPDKTLVTQLIHLGEIIDTDIKRVEAIKIIKDLLPEEDDEINVLTRKQVEACCLKVEISKETVKDAIQEMKANHTIDSKKLPNGHPLNPSGNTHKLFKPANRHFRKPEQQTL